MLQMDFSVSFFVTLHIITVALLSMNGRQTGWYKLGRDGTGSSSPSLAGIHKRPCGGVLSPHFPRETVIYHFPEPPKRDSCLCSLGRWRGTWESPSSADRRTWK